MFLIQVSNMVQDAVFDLFRSLSKRICLVGSMSVAVTDSYAFMQEGYDLTFAPNTGEALCNQRCTRDNVSNALQLCPYAIGNHRVAGTEQTFRKLVLQEHL